jgi:hypothetical protein
MTDEDGGYLKEGWVVYIDDPYNGFYRIARREPFDFVTGEESPAIFTPVLPGGQSAYQNVVTLEPDNDPLHLFQVRWGVQESGNVKYYLKVPTGQNRFGVDVNKEIGYINADKSPWFDPDPLFQFWLVHDWIPAVNMRNGSPTTITPKIWFRGMKYDIEKITNAGTISQLRQSGVHKKIVFGGVKNTP